MPLHWQILFQFHQYLELMGWLNIPFRYYDYYNCSNCHGIAVDDTIHFIHRFEDEFKIDHDYINA